MEQYRTMKKRAFLAGSAALLGCGTALAQGWPGYRNEEGNFHIEMPGMPKLGAADIPIGNRETAPMKEAVVRVPGAAYQVSYIAYPSRISSAASADVMLDMFRNNMSSGSAYRNETKITLGRFSGREFTVVQSSTLNIAVRIYWIRGKFYQLMVSGAPGISEARHSEVLRLVRPDQGVTRGNLLVNLLLVEDQSRPATTSPAPTRRRRPRPAFRHPPVGDGEARRQAHYHQPRRDPGGLAVLPQGRGRMHRTRPSLVVGVDNEGMDVEATLLCIHHPLRAVGDAGRQVRHSPHRIVEPLPRRQGERHRPTRPPAWPAPSPRSPASSPAVAAWRGVSGEPATLACTHRRRHVEAD